MPSLPEPRAEVANTSYSALTLHRKCPNAWHYRYLRGLAPEEYDRAPVERWFGSWWHTLRAADSIERGRRRQSLLFAPEILTTVDDGPEIPTIADDGLCHRVFDAAATWWHRLDEETRDLWTDTLGEPLPTGLVHADNRYRTRWQEDRDCEHPIAVEVHWQRPLPGCTTNLTGYCDEVYYDQRRHLTVVRDHKTAKSLSTQTTADDMMDSQLHFYAWGMVDRIREWGAEPVRAVSYDRMRSVAPSPPVLTQSGRIAVRGGEPSIGNCDLGTYLAWCDTGPTFPGRKKDGSDGGTYAAESGIVERLSTPAARSVWFQRTLSPLNRHLVRAHLQGACDSERDSQRTLTRVLRTGEAPRNLGPVCRWCDFAELCRAQMLGGPDGDYDPADYGLRVADRHGRAHP